MEVYDSLTEVMGNTPLLRLRSVTKGVAVTADVLAKVEYLNPGGSVKDRIALRMVETAERAGQARAGRRHRRADLGQHRRRAGHRRPGARLPLRVHLPGQGGRGQDRGAARLRRRGRGLPDQRAARPPGLLLQRRPPPGQGDPGRLAARPVLEPGQPGRALPLDRPGDLAADRRAGSPTSWRASAPAARSPAPAGTSRKSPAAGSRSSGPTRRARSTPAGAAARTWSRASARTSGPTPSTGRSPTR